MQTLDPTLMSTVAALCAAVLMVHAGIGKRMLTWRPERVRKLRPRNLQRMRRRWRR